MSIQIPVQERQCSCNYFYFSPAYSEVTIASFQITCQSCSWHLTAAVDRKLTNEINEIYLQPPRAKGLGMWCVTFLGAFRKISERGR